MCGRGLGDSVKLYDIYPQTGPEIVHHNRQPHQHCRQGSAVHTRSAARSGCGSANGRARPASDGQPVSVTRGRAPSQKLAQPSPACRYDLTSAISVNLLSWSMHWPYSSQLGSRSAGKVVIYQRNTSHLLAQTSAP